MKSVASHGPALGAAALSIVVSLNLLGCSNSLLEEARGAQAKAAAPRIGVFKDDGTALASEGSLDFGELSVGKGASLALTLKNSGVNDLVVAAADAAIAPGSGTADGIFSLDSYAGLTIKAGESGSLKIAFSPAAAATYAATLTIASNDIAQPLFKLSLSGKGSATAKALTSFGFPSIPAAGTIDEANKAVAVTAPIDTNPAALVATFETTGAKVLVGSTQQTSGSTVNSFANPVTYTVVAQDGSTADYVVTLTLKKVVPIMTTGSLSNITTNSASGSGTITSTGDGGAAVSVSGLCWATTQNPTLGGAGCFSQTGSATSGTFTAPLSSLASGTTYYVRAYATNSVGTGYGPQASFVTKPAEVTGVTATTMRGAVGSRKLKVDWTAQTGAVAYDVYASATNNFASAVIWSGGADISGATTCTLTGLTNYQNYYVWVVAKNVSGAGATSASAMGYVGVKATSVTLAASSTEVPFDSSLGVTATVNPSDASEPTLTWATTGDTSYFSADSTGHNSVAVVTTTATGLKSISVTASTSGLGNVVSSSPVSLSSTVPRSGLIGEYLFTGGSLDDTSGQERNATKTSGAAFCADNHGTANNAVQRSPASASAILTLPNTWAFYWITDFSFSFSFEALDLPSSGCPPILSQQSAAGQFQWDVHFDSAGKISAMAGTNPNQPNEISSSAVAVNTWHQVVMVINGQAYYSSGSPRMSLYIDGSLVGSTLCPSSTGNSGGSTTPFYVGNLSLGSNGYHPFGPGFRFNIDDIRIYNKALTASEAASLYNFR